MRIVVGITGASGVVMGIRLLEELVKKNHDVFGIITKNGRQVIAHEIDKDYKFPQEVQFYEEDDIIAPLNSSSFKVDAMVIVPCSLKTLAALSIGYAQSLIVRCAENVLRTNANLIVVPRETPLSASALENMLKLRRDGAVIFPPSIAYYFNPQNIDDMTNFFVGKIMDLLQINNQLYKRWN